MADWINTLAELWIIIGIILLFVIIVYLKEIVKNNKVKRFLEKIETFLYDLRF